MSAAAILPRLRAAGAEVALHNDRVVIGRASMVPADLLTEAKARRADLLASWRTTTPARKPLSCMPPKKAPQSRPRHYRCGTCVPARRDKASHSRGTIAAAAKARSGGQRPRRRRRRAGGAGAAIPPRILHQDNSGQWQHDGWLQHPTAPEKPAGVNTAHRETAICIEMTPPLLRSPHSGGPLVDRVRCEIDDVPYQAESKNGAICELCWLLLAYRIPRGRLSGAASWL